MVDTGSATTTYQDSYGTPAFSTALNAAVAKGLGRKVIDTVYGNTGRPISPVVALLGGELMEGITEVGNKLVWVASGNLPLTVTAPLRGNIDPTFYDEWTDRLEMAIGVIRTDMLVDNSLYKLFLAGSTSLVDAYAEFLARFSTSHQSAFVQRFYGDGVQGWDGTLATPALVNFTNEAGHLPIVGLGFAVESASRANALLSNSNTYAGKDRSLAANVKYRARLWDAQSATDFPAGSSPGTFTTVGAMAIAHLMYVANHTGVGLDIPDYAFMGTDEWLQFQNLAQIHSIMANPNGVDPQLRKWGFDHFVVGNVKFVWDKLHARPGQIVFVNSKTLKFHSVAKAQISRVYEKEDLGKDVYYQRIYTVGQFINKQPGSCGVLYNYGL